MKLLEKKKLNFFFYERVNDDDLDASLDKWLCINDLRKSTKKKTPKAPYNKEGNDEDEGKVLIIIANYCN